VIPGRCQPWMDQELRAAIKLRRELFAALKDACADGAFGNISEGEVDAADLTYTQQRKQVRKLAKAKKVALARTLDAAINRAWRKRVSLTVRNAVYWVRRRSGDCSTPSSAAQLTRQLCRLCVTVWKCLMPALLRHLHSIAATSGAVLPLHVTLLRPQAFSAMRTGMLT
jgi:hypothetical protein